MSDSGKDNGSFQKLDSVSALPSLKPLDIEQPKEFKLIERITSIENSDKLFTKSGHIGVKGRQAVDEIYADFLKSTKSDYKQCLVDIRQARLDLDKFATSEEINKRLNTILNSVRGKLVYDAHNKWAAFRFKRHIDEGVIGFDEIFSTEDDFYKNTQNFESLNDVFKNYLKQNNKSIWKFIDEQRQLQSGVDLDIYQEAFEADERFRKNIQEKTTLIEREIDQIIDKDLENINLEKPIEKIGFRQRIKNRLSTLTPKILNKKVIGAAASVAALSGIIYQYMEPLKPVLLSAIKPVTDKLMIHQDQTIGIHATANLHSRNINSLDDIEYLEDQQFGPDTSLFSDDYLNNDNIDIPELAGGGNEVTEDNQIQPNVENSNLSSAEFIKAETLQSDLNNIVEQAPGEWGIYVKEIGSDVSFGVKTNEVFHPASTIKIPIALEFFYFVDKQGLNHEEILNQIPSGEHRTFRQLLNNMLIDSDEAATEFLTAYINQQDGYNSNQILNSWGFDQIKVEPRRATPEQMGRLLEDFYTGKLGLSEESKKIILEILRTPSKDDFARLGASLPQNVRENFAHKFGTVLGDGDLFTVSDMGIVDLGNGTSYVIVGLSDLENKEDYPASVVVLQKTGGAVLNAFSSEYFSEQEIKQNSSTVFVDDRHANVGRLYNLQIVGNRLKGIVIPAGETVNLSEIALNNLDEYKTGFAYGTGDGTALGGGICGVASALAKEAERLGLQWKSEARHLPSDHAPGGLYENLLNGSFSSGKEFSITNTSGEDLVINFSSNYDMDDLPPSGAWNSYLDSKTVIGQDEFTVSIKLESKTEDIEIAGNEQIQNQKVENKSESLNIVSSAQYKRGEYFENMQINLDIATDKINKYFEQNNLNPSKGAEFTFSYNEVMDYYQDEEWTQTTGLLGAGACDIATLMYRAIQDYSTKIGNDLKKIDHDQRGHDIMQSDLFTVKKVDHRPYDGMPSDEIAVSSISPTNSWNSNFDLKINSQFLNGKDVPDDLNIKFRIYLDESGNYVAEIQSNYTVEELSEMAGQ